jgi:hypothetical protein
MRQLISLNTLRTHTKISSANSCEQPAGGRPPRRRTCLVVTRFVVQPPQDLYKTLVADCSTRYFLVRSVIRKTNKNVSLFYKMLTAVPKSCSITTPTLAALLFE